MIRAWSCWLALLALSLPAPSVLAADAAVAPAGPPSSLVLAELRPRVIALLGAPGAGERWKALGPEALTILRQLASDPAETSTRRAQAAASMAYVDNPSASDVLRSYATDGNALPALRQGAVLGLALREGTAAISELTPLLSDGEAEVRLGVAAALGSIGGVDARAALQARLPAESDPKVRDEIQKDLARTAN